MFRDVVLWQLANANKELRDYGGISIVKAVARQPSTRQRQPAEKNLASREEHQSLARVCGIAAVAQIHLPKLSVPAEARNRISTKVAFQYSVLPTQITDGAVQVVVSNPFDTAMLNSVRFDAHGPVRFALATLKSRKR